MRSIVGISMGCASAQGQLYPRLRLASMRWSQGYQERRKEGMGKKEGEKSCSSGEKSRCDYCTMRFSEVPGIIESSRIKHNGYASPG